MREAMGRAIASWRAPSAMLVAASALAGILIRIRQFVAGRSLWLDEAMVAHSVLDLDVVELVTSPLQYNQRAPAGFLVASDIATVPFGETDDALRVVSLVAGSLAVVLAVVLARRSLVSGLAQVTLVTAVAFSPVLIYYSVEVKQYTLDVTAVLAVLVANTTWGAQRRWWPLAVVGAVCMWFSHVVVLVMGVVWLTRVWETRNGEGRRPVVSVAVVWGVLAVFLGAQVLATSDDAANDILTKFWADAFAPVSWSWSSLRWYVDSALGLIHLGFEVEGAAGASVDEGWFGNENYLRLAAVVVCIAVVARSRRGALGVPALVLVAALVLSSLDVYPFRGRLILYLLPLVFFVCAIALDELAAMSMPWRLLGSVGAVVILAPTVLAGIALVRHPYGGSDMENALQFVAERFEEGDVIALGPGSRPAFDFYADEAGLADVETFNIGNDFDPEPVRVAIARREIDRLWVVITHRAGESRSILDEFDSSARILAEHVSSGSRVALYAIPPIAPGSPVIVPGSVSVSEGDESSVARVPVTMSQPLALAVTIDWTTVELETEVAAAVSGVDYEAGAGTVTFAPGETVQYVPITVLGDTLAEPSGADGELGFVQFSNPSGDVRVDQSFFGLGIFAIVDDD